MRLSDIAREIPERMLEILREAKIDELRPCQEKAIGAGLLKGKSVLVCTPTASGKTLVGELAFAPAIMSRTGKGIYIVPLKALAEEKFRDFRQRYGKEFKVALSIGDIDSTDPFLKDYDLIITTSEKLDSLIRHSAAWLRDVKVIVVDEIHLLNDPERGPTLEILLTMLMRMLSKLQIVGLSATIGNAKELGEWLKSEVIMDDWRPVKLRKGIMMNNTVEFFE